MIVSKIDEFRRPFAEKNQAIFRIFDCLIFEKLAYMIVIVWVKGKNMRLNWDTFLIIDILMVSLMRYCECNPKTLTILACTKIRLHRITFSKEKFQNGLSFFPSIQQQAHQKWVFWPPTEFNRFEEKVENNSVAGLEVLGAAMGSSEYVAKKPRKTDRKKFGCLGYPWLRRWLIILFTKSFFIVQGHQNDVFVSL